MSNPVQGIIFDFDGVLLDSYSMYLSVNQHAAQSIGKTLSQEEYQGWFMDSVRVARQAFVGTDEANQRYEAAYRTAREQSFTEATMFPDAISAIQTLASTLPLAVASITEADIIHYHLKRAGIDSYFTSVLGLEPMQRKKEMILLQSLTALGTTAADTAFVTDSVSDVREGYALGLRPIAVTWGFHNRAKLEAAKPEAVVDTFAELITVLSGKQ